MIRVDYANVRALKKRGIFQKYTKEIGGVLFCVGFVLLFIASGEPKEGFSIFLNVGIGILGGSVSFAGLCLLDLLSSSSEWK